MLLQLYYYSGFDSNDSYHRVRKEMLSAKLRLLLLVLVEIQHFARVLEFHIQIHTHI